MMNGSTIKNEVTNRAWRIQTAVLALTLLVFILGATTTARAQGHAGGGGGGAGKATFSDMHFVAKVGVARGQTVRITFRILSDQAQSAQPNGKLYLGTDVGVWGVHVKAFNALTGAEIKSFDLRNPSAGIYTFDIGGDGRDLLIGGENTDRARTEVKIEFTWLVHLDRAPNEPGDSIDPPTFEVVDKDTGRTTVRGELVKVGTGHLVLSNVNTY